MDRASSPDARGPGFEPCPLHLKKYYFFTPKPIEVPIRGWVQLRILELGDEAEEKGKKCPGNAHFRPEYPKLSMHICTPSPQASSLSDGSKKLDEAAAVDMCCFIS